MGLTKQKLTSDRRQKSNAFVLRPAISISCHRLPAVQSWSFAWASALTSTRVRLDRQKSTHCSPSASKISAVSCYQVAGRCRALSTIQGASEPDDAIELGQICCWVAICPLQSRTEKTSTIDVALSIAETSWERNVQTFKPASYWAI